MADAMREFAQEQMERSVAALSSMRADKEILGTLMREAREVANRLSKGGKLMIAGNGGSAADAQHMAAEFVSRLTKDRPAMHALALTTDSSILTAVGNDYGYDKVFQRQIEAVGRPEDVFLAISTSGNSPSILLALRQCRAMGIRSIGLTGQEGGAMKDLCDAVVRVPSRITQHIQECHLVLEHTLCGLVERACFGLEYFAS